MSASETRGYRRAAVLGAAGMLGFEIVRQLRAAGKEVRTLDLNALPRQDGSRGSQDEHVLGDIRDPQALRRACRGAEVVFQTAAAVWNPRTPAREFQEVNVEGNRRVLEACRELAIRRLVYTSTLDVVVDGRKPIVDGDESLPYPRRLPRDPYSRSKILAEKLVLEANGPELATCALRPVGMYGPRDRYHLGNFVAMARRGLSLRLGDGSARFSHVYSENAAHAHLLAAERLWPGAGPEHRDAAPAAGGPAAGQCYFLCDHYPAGNIFDFMAPFLEALRLPVPRRRVPYPLACALAALAEVVAPRSNFNRFAVVQTCVDHTFVDRKAARELGYVPLVSREEAFERSLAWLRERDRGLTAAGRCATHNRAGK
jgi:nucleoside-diphosphate-sugar epimerase